MGGYPGLRCVKIFLFSYRCITNGVGGPIAAKLCADVTVTWIRTEKLLGGVISLAQGFYESRHFMLLALERVTAPSKVFQVAHNGSTSRQTSRRVGPFQCWEFSPIRPSCVGAPDKESRRNSRPCGTLPILERTRESWWLESQRRQAEASWLAAKLRASVPCGYAP
jgi:hypothetical protein